MDFDLGWQAGCRAKPCLTLQPFHAVTLYPACLLWMLIVHAQTQISMLHDSISVMRGAADHLSTNQDGFNHSTTRTATCTIIWSKLKEFDHS